MKHIFLILAFLAISKVWAFDENRIPKRNNRRAGLMFENKGF